MKHVQVKNPGNGKQEAASASRETEVVLLLAGQELLADHQYCRESGVDYLPVLQHLRTEEEEAKRSGT